MQIPKEIISVFINGKEIALGSIHDFLKFANHVWTTLAERIGNFLVKDAFGNLGQHFHNILGSAVGRKGHGVQSIHAPSCSTRGLHFAFVEHCYSQFRIGLVHMQRGKGPRRACADDDNVGFNDVIHTHLLPLYTVTKSL